MAEQPHRPRHYAALIGGLWRCCCGWMLAASGPEADAAVEKHVWGAA